MTASLRSIAAYENAAREVLPRMVYDYYAGGSDDEQTVRANVDAYRRIFLRPRVLRDVSAVDTEIEVLGEPLPFPVLLAPTAFQRLAHPEGELATARAARAVDTLMVGSTLSTVPLERVAETGARLWFQLYVFRDREVTRDLVARAEASGHRALCLTVTVPVQGNRERDARNSFQLPDGLELANFKGGPHARLPKGKDSHLSALVRAQFDPTLDWSSVEWLRSITRLPILVKGVQTPEDARLAIEHGAAGIIVSNHGGRQLDTAEPTLFALPRVAQAVAAEVPVLVDGGIRRGTDVVKALALGATAVLVGRPYLWALAVDGEVGVVRALRTLREEFERTLALIGRTHPGDLGPEVIAIDGGLPRTPRPEELR